MENNYFQFKNKTERRYEHTFCFHRLAGLCYPLLTTGQLTIVQASSNFGSKYWLKRCYNISVSFVGTNNKNSFKSKKLIINYFIIPYSSIHCAFSI